MSFNRIFSILLLFCCPIIIFSGNELGKLQAALIQIESDLKWWQEHRRKMQQEQFQNSEPKSSDYKISLSRNIAQASQEISNLQTQVISTKSSIQQELHKNSIGTKEVRHKI